MTQPAARPPRGLPGLDPSWSRLVTAADADGIERTWHVLDTAAADPDATTPIGTLLCVHGNPTWSYLWRDLLASAPSGWRVIAVDHLDMGFSERTGTVRGLERRIDDLDRLTAALELEGPVVTVAHDWGGPISLGWALRHRDQLHGIVLTNTAVHQPVGSPAPSLIRMARTPGVLDTVCVRTPTFIKATMALATPSLPREVQQAYAAPYTSAERRAAIGGFVRDIPLEPDHPSAAALDAVAAGVSQLGEVPVLLLWGPADPVFGDLYLGDLHARLPHADIHRFPTASHLAVEDVDVAGTIGTWLTEQATDSDAGRPEAGPSSALWAALEDPANRERTAIVELPAASTGRARDAAADGATEVTFGELSDAVQELGAGMAAAGVRAGDRVALLVPPGIELATAVYACWRIGAIVVLADAGLGARGITHALRAASPDYLIGIPRALAAAKALRWPGERIAVSGVPTSLQRATSARWTLPALQELGVGASLPEPPGLDDEAAVVFTSGATGAAKGVVYRHRQVQAQRDALVRTYGITSDDRLVAAFAPFALYGPTIGITSVVPDMDVTSPGTLRAGALADAIAAVEATLVFASPAALVSVLRSAEALSETQRTAMRTPRMLMSAGAPVPAELLRSMGELLPHAEPHTPYGMTEALPVADISLEQIEAAGAGNGVCVGVPVDGVEIAISPIDTAGNAEAALTTDPGVIGEICVRAAHVKDRYDRLWVTEQRSSRNAGYHRSGDVGHLDDHGRLWVEGRMVHVITTDTGVVTPVGIERKVESIPHVSLAAAVGVGPAGTQQIVVVVATDPAPPGGRLAPRTLTAAVRRVLDVPVAAVLVTPQLPVDIRHNSKIDRARVAEWAATMLAGKRAGSL